MLVICDAESRVAQARWTAIRATLAQAGYENLPEQMDPEGVVSELDGERRVGVWIMPDNESQGMIEDFYLRAIPENDRELVRAGKFVDEIPSEERLFREKVSKAKFGVWLAIQKEPASPAQSLSWRLIRPESGLLPRFQAWLDRVLA